MFRKLNLTSGKLIGIILILSSLLRLLTVHKFMVFSPDEEYQAYFAQTLIKNFHIIWIGMSAGSFDLYLGPFWIYIIYPFLKLFKGDPLVLGYIASILGIFATYLVYLVGKKIFNLKVALIASMLYAASPLVIFYDQKPYPSGLSFLSLMLLYSLLMTRHSKKWWLVFAATYGLVFHIHLSLIPIIFTAIYYCLSNKKLIDKKTLLKSFLIFLLTVSPLIVFDYFHKGSNILTPLRVISSAKETKLKPNTSYHLNTLFDSLGRSLYIKPFSESSDQILYPCAKATSSEFSKSPFIFSFFSLLIFVLFIFKKSSWKDPQKRLLILLGLSFLLPFTILPIINPVEYYLMGFFPLLFLIIASVIDSFKSPLKIMLFGLLIGVSLLGIFSILTAKADFGLKSKKNLIQRVTGVIKGASFDLEEIGGCQRYGGFRYLFSIYGKTPNISSEDHAFGWLYKDELKSTKGDYYILLSETRTEQKNILDYKLKIEEGGFSAYIQNN